jgi:DNA repair protein RadC
MKRKDVYDLIRQNRYDEAAYMLLESTSPFGPIRLSGPGDAFPLLRKYGAKRKEHFIALLLNGAHEIVHEEIISIGIVNRTIVHPREVFYPAILHNAAAILIAHNHPSGRLDPSPEDLELTKKLKEAADILGIALLDHLVISRSGYFSFTEHGFLESFTSE